MAVTYPLTRNPVKIFAGEASSNTYVTEFKTTESETPAFGNTPAQIQTDAYSQGWINVNNANNVVPYGEDLNAVCLSLSYHIGYLMQDGIPEWDLETHYTINSFCKVGGTLYKSLVANNIGHDPSVTGNESYWSPMELAPTTASNVGGGAGWYKGKVGADLKFKTLVVEGTAVLEDTDPDILTLRVSSDPSQIVSVPFANVTGAVDSNANLRDALNAKQDLLNYVAENVVNKVTTVAIDPAVASDTLYPSQKAVSTIAANNLTAAKAYADNLLKHSAGARYYPVSSASASSGALSNTVGSTQAEVGWVTLNTTEQLLFTFSMTTASVISTNESNNYDFLLPLSSLSNQRKYSLRAKLTIKDPDEEAVTLFNYNIPTITPSGTNYLLEVKVNNVNRENLSFPIGSEVTLAIYGKVDSNTSDLKLTLNGASNTCALNRNIDLGLNLATFVNTSASGTSQNQEDMNKYLYNAIQTIGEDIYTTEHTWTEEQKFLCVATDQIRSIDNTGALSNALFFTVRDSYDNSNYNLCFRSEIDNNNLRAFYPTNLTPEIKVSLGFDIYRWENVFSYGLDCAGDLLFRNYDSSGNHPETKISRALAGKLIFSPSPEDEDHIEFSSKSESAKARIYPRVNRSVILGSEDLMWEDIFAYRMNTYSIYGEGDLTLGASSSIFGWGHAVKIAHVDGDLGTFRPGTSLMDIGTSDYRWKTIYAENFNLTDNLTYSGSGSFGIKRSTSGLVSISNGAATWYFDNTLFRPASSGFQDIGAGGFPLNAVYANYIIKTASNVSGASESGNIRIDESSAYGGNYFKSGIYFRVDGTEKAYIYVDNAGASFLKIFATNNIDVISNTQGVRLATNATSWSSLSDRRAKKNIITLEDSLSKINLLTPIRFDFRTDSTNTSDRVGFIAQDVKEVIPEAVGGEESETETLYLSQESLIPFLVGAVKELSAQVEELKSIIGDKK